MNLPSVPPFILNPYSIFFRRLRYAQYSSFITFRTHTSQYPLYSVRHEDLEKRVSSFHSTDNILLPLVVIETMFTQTHIILSYLFQASLSLILLQDSIK
jgi:hypothetical protein